MTRLLITVLLFIVLPIDVRAQVSFTQDVLPILTRSGCNQGACHGTPTGKGGFRLSLRGYDPASDVQTLTREASGRRLNRLDPDASLLLQKGCGSVAHEGGVRFAPTRSEYRILKQWIAEGAGIDLGSAPEVVRVEVSPNRIALEPGQDTIDLRVHATTADGVRRDITHLVRFSVNDELAAAVSRDGRVSKRLAGEVAVAAEYRGQMVTSLISFLPPTAAQPFQRPREHNFIDTHVLNKLEQLRIAPATVCDDATFLRRVTLDLTGLLPTADEVRAFLANSSPDKRAKWIDELLQRDAYADFWAMKWTDRLGCNQRFVGKIGAQKYHAWIRQQIAANVPEDAFVRSILTASGGNYSSPPVGFHRRLKDPALAAEEVAQLFLGVRIGCAKCHNHPGERWTQDDYYGLAAFFARQKFRDGPFFNHLYDKEETLSIIREGEVKHPRTGKVMPPRFLGSPTPVLDEHTDRRVAFADWLTAAENPFFARASVNRIWFHLFGRGIVDPVDDMRLTNPPANAELLDALSREFVQHGFDRKHLIRLICNSRTYQQVSIDQDHPIDEERYFARARLRLIAAEPLLDAISQATGQPERFRDLPAGVRAVQLPDGETKHPFLEAFGRPARAMTCECERGEDTTLSQALHLIGGKTVQVKLRSDTGRIAQLISAGKSDTQIIEELFLASLSRLPTAEEHAFLLPRFKEADRRAVAEDVLWALFNHREFVFQR